MKGKSALSKERMEALVGEELSAISEQLLLETIKPLLVTPYVVKGAWDYGKPGETFECWTVLEHAKSNTGIAYCQEGFGPSYPWGLVFLAGPHMGIGMDSGWHISLEHTFRNSMGWHGQNPHGYEIP
jgi:hypothetical protein